jgi:hypothetical protein
VRLFPRGSKAGRTVNAEVPARWYSFRRTGKIEEWDSGIPFLRMNG